MIDLALSDSRVPITIRVVDWTRLIAGGVAHQFGRVPLEILGHGVDAAELCADAPGPVLRADAVMNQPLAQSNDFNLRGAGFPNLPSRQCPVVL